MPGAPLPIGCPSMLHDRHDDVGGGRDESLAGGLGLLDRERPLDEFDGFALQDVDERGAGDAAQDGLVDLAGDEAALLVDDPGVGRGAFRDVTLLVDEPGFLGAVLRAPLLWPARPAAASPS